MTKRSYTILRRKLEQLEAIIARFSALPPPGETVPWHQLLAESQSIEQRFDFLKNLLSTEMASTHPSKPPPHHLSHIERKLNQLESTFHDYRKSIIISYNDSNNNNNVDDDDHDDDSDDHSVCSYCTESCLNGTNGEVLAESGFRGFGLSNNNSTTTVYGGHDQEAENFYDAVAPAPPVEDLMKGKKWRVCKRRYCAVIVVGVILIINFSSYFHDTGDHEGFLVPT